MNYQQQNVGLARTHKQPMVLQYMVQEGLAHGFKTMYEGDVVMLVPNKIKNNNKILYVGHK